MIQTSKTETGDHCKCDFRHIPLSLRQKFSELYQTQTLPTVLKTLWSQGLPYNNAIFSNGNQYLLNKYTYFLPAPILILDKYHT